MNATIKDVALAAGVSIGTVDRVLHNRQHVNNIKRERVLKEIERLGYKTNKHASLLSTGVRKTVGFICLTEPGFFWNELAEGAEAAANELRISGIDLIVKKIGYKAMTDRYLDAFTELSSRNIDLLLMVGIINDKLAEAINSSPVPVALVNIDHQEYSKKVFYIGPDEEKCGCIAAGLIGKFLKGEGRVIATCPEYEGTPAHSSSMRIQGFKKILNNNSPNISLPHILRYDAADRRSYIDLLTNDIHRYLPDAVYFPSGDMTGFTECINVISENVKRPIIVVHELNTQTRNLLKKDAIDAVISQHPYKQGYESVKNAYFYLYDGIIPKHGVIHADISIITREML